MGVFGEGIVVPILKPEETAQVFDTPLAIQAEVDENALAEMQGTPELFGGVFGDKELEAILGGEQNLLKSAIGTTTQTPDSAAADKTLADDAQLPLQAVGEGTREDIQKQVTQDRMMQIPNTAPVTRGVFGDDPLTAILSSDDIPNIVKGEHAIQGLTFQGAFSHGIDLLQGLGWRFVEATGELIGSEDLEAFGQAKAEAEFAQAEAGGVKKRFLDIDSVGDFFTWLKQTGGEQIPLMAPSVVASIAGGAAGAWAGPVGIVIGSMLGAFIPSFILGVGETQNAIKERDKNVEAPGAAFGAGAIIGALDSLLPGKIGTMVRKAFGREAGAFWK